MSFVLTLNLWSVMVFQSNFGLIGGTVMRHCACLFLFFFSFRVDPEISISDFFRSNWDLSFRYVLCLRSWRSGTVSLPSSLRFRRRQIQGSGPILLVGVFWLSHFTLDWLLAMLLSVACPDFFEDNFLCEKPFVVDCRLWIKFVNVIVWLWNFCALYAGARTRNTFFSGVV